MIPNSVTEFVDYKVITDDPSEKDKHAKIMLLRDPYKDVIISFGKLSFADQENDDGSLNAEFNYDVIEAKGTTKEELEKDPNFNNFLGDILIDILQNYLEEKDEIDQTGNNDPEGISV